MRFDRLCSSWSLSTTHSLTPVLRGATKRAASGAHTDSVLLRYDHCGPVVSLPLASLLLLLSSSPPRAQQECAIHATTDACHNQPERMVLPRQTPFRRRFQARSNPGAVSTETNRLPRRLRAPSTHQSPHPLAVPLQALSLAKSRAQRFRPTHPNQQLTHPQSHRRHTPSRQQAPNRTGGRT